MGINITKDKRETNLWHIDVRIRRLGKETRQREKFRGTKSEAEERFVQLKREILDGVPVTPVFNLNTFGEVLQVYKERREAHGPVDRARYKRLFHELGQTPIALFSEQFDRYIKLLRTTASKDTGKPLSNGTINRFVALANSAFNLVVSLELLDKNPLTKARFPKLRETPRDRTLTDTEKNLLLATINANAPHLYALARYALQVPCRRSELINMRREDLDLENGRIRVRNGTTKNNQGCDKPIPPDMVEYFRTLPIETDYLFYRVEGGRCVGLGWFSKSWYKCLRIAGIENFRFHDTRHIAATEMLDRGSPERAVMQVAGWKSGNIISTYYHRDSKKSLSLIKFEGSGQLVDSMNAKAA